MQWSPPASTGPNGPVLASCAFDPDGFGPANPLVLVGGYFGLGAGGALTNVALHDPVADTWSTIGSGVDSTVAAVLRLSTGDLVAGGAFGIAGGQPAANVARWDGVTWSGFGAGPGGVVRALAELQNGVLVAGGDFGIAAWNGSAWMPMGNGPSFVGALAVRQTGALVAGGFFAGALGVQEWNGSAWTSLGTASGDIRSLLVLDSGELVAGGAFTSIGGTNAIFAARWDGVSWSAMPGLDHSGRALARLPNGDVVAGGGLATASSNPDLVSRWNGSTWSVLGGGMNAAAYTLAVVSNGDLFAGGTFTTLAGSSPYVARLTTTCPASIASGGIACSGTAGPVSLVPASLPWAGSTFRAVANGMPALGVAVHVLGFSSVSIPLGSVLPQAAPGCLLSASPDFTEILLPAAGSVQAAVALPNTAAIAGLQIVEQVVTLDISASLVITSAASSNFLTLTIGAL